MTKSCAKLLVLVLLGAAVHAATLGAQEKSAGKEMAILDTSGFWRFYLTLRTPVVRDGDRLEEIGADLQHSGPGQRLGGSRIRRFRLGASGRRAPWRVGTTGTRPREPTWASSTVTAVRWRWPSFACEASSTWMTRPRRRP